MIEPFKNPGLRAPSPLRIDGEAVYGHVAAWGTEHIGRRGVTPPRNHTDYRFFHLGAYDLNGVEVDCGQITLHAGHPSDMRLGADEARKAYEHTGTVAAYVRCGEDEHGIWFSGRLAKGLADSDLEALRASKMSGDWRPINGRAELIGVLAVNIPGFPITRPRVLVAAGAEEPLALVACGMVPNEYVSETRLRLRYRVARRALAMRVKG